MKKKNILNKKFDHTNNLTNNITNNITNENINIKNSSKKHLSKKPDFEISQRVGVEFENFNGEIRCNLDEKVKYQILSVELDKTEIGLTYNSETKKVEGVPTECCAFSVTIKYKVSKWKFLQEQKTCVLNCEIVKNNNLPRLRFRVNNVKQFEVVEGLKIVHFDKSADHYSIDSVNFIDENVNHFVYDRSQNVINGLPTKIAQCSLEIKYYYKNICPGKIFTNNVDFFVLENKQALKLDLFVNTNNKSIKQFEDFTAKIQAKNTNLHCKNWEITSVENIIELHKKGIDINVKNKTISGNTLFSGIFVLDIEYDVIVDGKSYSFAEKIPLKIVSNEAKLHAHVNSLGTAKYLDFYYNKVNLISKIAHNNYSNYLRGNNNFEPRVVNVIIDNNNFYYDNTTQEIVGYVSDNKDIDVTIEYDYPVLSKMPNLSLEYSNHKVFTHKQTIKVVENTTKPKLEFVAKNAYYNVPFAGSLDLVKKPIFENIDPYYIVEVKFDKENSGLYYNHATKRIEGIPKLVNLVKPENAVSDDKNSKDIKDIKDIKQTIKNIKDIRDLKDLKDNKHKTAVKHTNENSIITATIFYTYYKDKLNDSKWKNLIKQQTEIKLNISKAPPPKKDNEDNKYRKENSANECIKGKEKSIIAARQCVNTNHQKTNHCENDFYIKYNAKYDCYVAVLADGSNAAKFSYYASKLVVNVAGEILDNNLEKNLPNIVTVFNKFYNTNNKNENTNNINTEAFEKSIKRVLYNLIGISVFTAYKKLEQEYNTNKNVIGDIKNLSTTLMLTVIKKIGKKWLCVSYSVGDGVIVIYNNKLQPATHNLLLGKISNNNSENHFLSKKEISSYDEIIKNINVSVVDNFTALIMLNNGIAQPKFHNENNLKQIETWNGFWAELNKEIPNLLGNIDGKNSNELNAKNLMKWINFADEKSQNDRVLAIIY